MKKYIAGVIILIVIVCLYISYKHDQKTIEDYGEYRKIKGKFKKILISFKDSAIRGFLISLVTSLSSSSELHISEIAEKTLLWSLGGGAATAIIETLP